MSTFEADDTTRSDGETWVCVLPKVDSQDPVHSVLQELLQAIPTKKSFIDEDEFRDEVEVFRRNEVSKKREWNTQSHVRLSALLGVFADLTKQGWVFRIRRNAIEGRRPDGGDTVDERRIRQFQFHAQRNEQLRTQGVQNFIRKMEQPRYFGQDRVSIFTLMRDGRDLKSALEKCIARGAGDYRDAINPYIQIVDDKTICSYTGFRLLDIWRYFRHTWSNPYQSVPGRCMMLLIRDKATKSHPIIGIAAISSASVRLATRDKHIGWEPETIIKRMEENPSKKYASWLLNSIDKWINDIYKSDLIEDGLLNTKSLRSPDEKVVKTLREEEERCRVLHHRLMRAEEYKSSTTHDADASVYWEKQARTPLFRSKRCSELSALLSARLILNSRGPTTSRQLIKTMLSDSVGMRVISEVTKRAKAKTVGISIADLTVCGAIPPYNEILGGKLVAMMAISPEVVAAYRKRYSGAESVIASSMAGRPVVRDASLVFVGTTSLYGKRPSQYDRISIPASVLGKNSNNSLRYEYLTDSKGWGTFQFSQSTSKAIGDYLRTTKNGTRVNYVFGEGANPRLRALRDGLNSLGLNSQELLQHGLKKGVYGVTLVENLADYLLGMVKHPAYVFVTRNPHRVTSAIVTWWMTRWLEKRLNRSDSTQILSKLTQNTLIQPITHGARVLLPKREPAQVDFLDEAY